MAFCSNCGKEIAVDAQFCSGCGVALDATNKSEKEQRKTVYDGDLHKCPRCGEHLNAFATICPACNYELRGVQATSCVHELSQKLEKTNSDEQKSDLISNFYIPNTKEDIYEFFILAYSYVSTGTYEVEAWSVKLEQAYLKAKIAFGNSDEYEHIKELYEKINKSSIKIKLKRSKDVKAIALTALGLVLILFGVTLPEIVKIYMEEFFWGIAGLAVIPFITGIVLFVVPNQKNNKK